MDHEYPISSSGGGVTDSDRPELSWRIPVNEGALEFRARSLRILIASGIFLALVMILGGEEIRRVALIALAPLALFLMWWAHRSSRPGRTPKDNIRLDRAGLHWRNEFGAENTIARDGIDGFRIGLDPDTVRAIPALTLILAGGFESQPVELHHPATPTCVRQFLQTEWEFEETVLDHNLFVRNLRASLLAALHSQSSDQFRFLRYSLVQPALQADGSWLVCNAEDMGQLRYEPPTCSFRYLQSGKAVLLEDISDVADHVRDKVLPRGFERRDLMSRMDEQSLKRERQAITHDARQVGFYAESDQFGNVHFIGSRSGLSSFCDKLDEVASDFQPAPPGAKPPSLNAGGDAMPLEIELRDQPWIAGETVSGPSTYLEDLARRFRERVAAAEIDSDFTLRAFDSPRSKVTFHVIVRGEDFDPASIAEKVT